MKRLVVATVLLAGLVVSSAAGQRIKLAASLADLEKAVRKDSNDAAAHYNVALAYWNARRWDDADSALHRAIRLDRRFAAAYIALAGLPYAQRDQLLQEEYEHRVPEAWRSRIEQSNQMYRQAVLIDPLVEVRIGYILLPDFGKFPTSLRLIYGDWIADYYEGQYLYFEGKYHDAYERFQRVYNDLDAASHTDRLLNYMLFWHGLAAAQDGKHDDALWDFGRLHSRYVNAELSSRDSTLRFPLRTNEFRYILGVMKQRAGKFNEAIDLYREALQNDLGLYMAHVRLAQIYEDHNMLPQAVAERRAAVNANPDDPSLLLDLGKTLAHATQWIDAEQALHSAVEANPRDPRSYYFLGIVQERQNKAVEARVTLTQFIALAPSRYAPQVADAKQRLDALR